MIERTFDAAFFNRIMNLPEVRPGLAPMEAGELDLSAVINNPLNFALRTEHGGFILIAHGAGFYSVHTQFAAKGRGAHALEAMRAGLDFMFTRTDCMHIHSHCPDSNPAALALAKAGGAHLWFRKEADATYGPGQMVRWDILDWMVTAPDLEADGQAFHDMLEGAKKAQASALPIHDDEPAHDKAVGAASRMCKRGQARKGVVLYNKWAEAAGYVPISLISDDPVRVDVVDAIVGLNRAGEMEVIQCR